MENEPVAKQTCIDLGEHHHWVSHSVPGLKMGWVIQCSMCDEYNVCEMNLYIIALEQEAVKEYLRREYELR